jgi:protein TonB
MQQNIFFYVYYKNIIVMKAKKNFKKDITHYRVIFFQIGIIISLSIILLAFEWKTYENNEIMIVSAAATQIDSEIIIYTKQDLPKPPQMKITEIKTTSNDDIEVDDVVDLLNIENGKNDLNAIVPVEIVDDPIADIDTFVLIPEITPQFPGGFQAMYEYIKDNLKYTDIAKKANITGTIYIEFTVEKDGRLTDVHVVRGIGGGLDEEAVRVIESMPKWEPARQGGIPVKVKYQIPINFNFK